MVWATTSLPWIKKESAHGERRIDEHQSDVVEAQRPRTVERVRVHGVDAPGLVGQRADDRATERPSGLYATWQMRGAGRVCYCRWSECDPLAAVDAVNRSH
jgi:hypothetical protein